MLWYFMSFFIVCVDPTYRDIMSGVYTTNKSENNKKILLLYSIIWCQTSFIDQISTKNICLLHGNENKRAYADFFYWLRWKKVYHSILWKTFLRIFLTDIPTPYEIHFQRILQNGIFFKYEEHIENYAFIMSRRI